MKYTIVNENNNLKKQKRKEKGSNMLIDISLIHNFSELGTSTMLPMLQLELFFECF